MNYDDEKELAACLCSVAPVEVLNREDLIVECNRLRTRVKFLEDLIAAAGLEEVFQPNE